MAFEQFRTQVLLLHSRQSTLDSLSAGFSGRYSVHCATSGSEALLTLGETPIHVIVSAQDLPGMSGLEALREARKRSPETMGILLAGTDTSDGLEAMVGDEQVFRIIRGEVTPQAIIDMIESAGKSQRLLALSESANDTRANVDEPVGEHIIMETAENGSTIISDGTARFPAVKPGKVDVVPRPGNRSVDVLVLTKDDEFISTIKNSARGLHNVHHAVTPAQADDIVRKHKVGVLVTDAAMAGTGVESVTRRLRKERPRLVAIVAGRRDDGELLMDLINRGHVYRFLLKPVSPGRARLAIEASVKHHLEAPDKAFEPKPGVPTFRPPTQKADTAAKRDPQPPRERTVDAKPANIPSDRRIEPTIRVEATEAKDAGKVAEAKAGTPPRMDESRSARDSLGVGGLSGGSELAGKLLQKPKLLAIAGGTVIAVVAVAWLALSGDAGDEERTAESAPAAVEQPALPEPSVGQTTVATLPEETVPVEEDPEPVPPPVVTPAPDPWAGELELARAARDSGNLINPPGLNAVELYLEAMLVSDNNPTVADELSAVLDQILSMAEIAVLARNVDQARSAMDMVRLAEPENTRLAFLDAQLAQLQFRNKAEQVRSAIRDARFEDADVLISEARSLTGSDPAEVDALTEELTDARFQQRIDAQIALANERLTAGVLTSPADDSARFHFEAVLAEDPDNQAARQGLVAVAGMLVLQARNAIDNGDFERADAILGQAGEIDAESSELRAANTALSDAREAAAEAARRAEEARLAEIRRREEEARRAEEARLAEIKRQEEEARRAEEARLAEIKRQEEAARQAELDRQAELERQAELRRQQEEQRQAELARQEAERIEAERRSAEEAEAALLRAEQKANEAATASPLGVGAAPPKPAPRRTAPSSTRNTNTASSEPARQIQEPIAQPPAATQVAAAAPATASVTEPRVQEQSANAINVRQEIAPEPEAGSGEEAGLPEMVPASRLNRVRYVGPEYPRSARRREITGSVDVTFTVTAEGEVRDAIVLRSEPGDTFDQAALDAVLKWRFDPVIENGEPVEKRTAVRLAFDLQ